MTWVRKMLIDEKEVEMGSQAGVDPCNLGRALQLGGSLGAVLIYIQWQSVFPTRKN